MMEEEKNNMGSNSMDQPGHMDHSHCCGYCGMYGMHGGHRHGLLRLLLGIVILMIVFWLGVKIGEFKGEYGGMGSFGQYGGRRMMNSQPMMYWGSPVNQEGYPAGMIRATTTPIK